MYPLLSLADIAIDTAVARRFPRRLAYYHLALPIAEDEDNITVALVYPENQKVVKVLETVLGTTVTPVRSDADEIRQRLDQVWQEEGEAAASTLLLLAEAPDAADQVQVYGAHMASALGLEPSALVETVDDLLRHAATLRPALIVAALHTPSSLSGLLSRSTETILLVRGRADVPQRLLVVLRGHTPDRRVLDWVIPIAHHHGTAITLLAAATASITDYRLGNPLSSDFANLLSAQHPAHLMEYGHILASVNVQGRIKIRQGSLDEVIIAELSSHTYDMVAIAIEAYGDFVYQVLQRLEDNHSAFLMIKP